MLLKASTGTSSSPTSMPSTPAGTPPPRHPAPSPGTDSTPMPAQPPIPSEPVPDPSPEPATHSPIENEDVMDTTLALQYLVNNPEILAAMVDDSNPRDGSNQDIRLKRQATLEEMPAAIFRRRNTLRDGEPTEVPSTESLPSDVGIVAPVDNGLISQDSILYNSIPGIYRII